MSRPSSLPTSPSHVHGLLAGLAAALLAAACSTPPVQRFHSLLPAEAPPASAASVPLPALPVDLGPVSVPAAVDQPQWLVGTADGSLRPLEQERWAAPLRDEWRAALIDGLVRRWGAVDLRSAHPPRSEPGWRLRVDIVRFDTRPGSGTRLQANWTAVPLDKSSSQPAIGCSSQLRESAGSDPLSLASAHQRMASRLADQIGQQLRTPQAPCPVGDTEAL